MRYLFSLVFIFIAYFSVAQVNASQNGTQFIAQFTYLENLSDQQVDQIEQNLQQNTNIRMARVDRITKGVFIVTNELSQLDESMTNSWLGVSFPVIDCFRNGVYRVDDVIPFDENFCNSTD